MASKPKKPQVTAPQYPSAEAVTPTFQQLTLPELRTALTKFAEQERDFPGLQKTISTSAREALKAREELFPGYMGTLGQAWQIAQERGAGLVSPEIAERVSKMAAEGGFATGTLPGSEQTRLQAARSYGLTAQQLQDSGMQIGQALRAEAVSTMPLQALNLAFTPQQIRQEDVNLAMYNNQIANRQALARAQAVAQQGNLQAQANADAFNRQQQINYEYGQRYGGSPFGGILGGALGMGAGAAIGSVIPGIGTMIGAGLGAQLGGGVGGAFGGAQSQQFGGIFGGLGGSIAGLGSMNQFGGFGGGFSSFGAAQAAAPFAASYTPYMGGFVPRAQPITP